MQSGRAAPRRSPPVPGLTAAEADAYWLEDDLGNRVSRLFRTSDSPLRLAGRVLENLGHVDGWTVAWRNVSGDRQVRASGSELATLATPHMPARSADEAATSVASTRPVDAILRFRSVPTSTPTSACTDAKPALVTRFSKA